MATVLGTLLGILTAGDQLWPIVRGALSPQQELTDESRGEIRAWAREAARDGVTTAEERATLQQLVSNGRLREHDIDAYLAEIGESIGQSADLVRQGAALVEHGEFSQARDRFLLATSRDSENVQGWVNLGAASLELGLLSEAETELRRALELDPDRWTAHYNLGASLAGGGSEERALCHLERSLELAAAAGLSEAEKRSVRRDLGANRWLEPLRHLPRFEALLRHAALETQGI